MKFETPDQAIRYYCETQATIFDPPSSWAVGMAETRCQDGEHIFAPTPRSAPGGRNPIEDTICTCADIAACLPADDLRRFVLLARTVADPREVLRLVCARYRLRWRLGILERHYTQAHRETSRQLRARGLIRCWHDSLTLDS